MSPTPQASDSAARSIPADDLRELTSAGSLSCSQSVSWNWARNLLQAGARRELAGEGMLRRARAYPAGGST